jgi:cytidyltransferase-like protein
MTSPKVIVSGGFDKVQSRDLRLFEEASKLGMVEVLLWSDRLIANTSGKEPELSLGERLYVLRGVRYINHVRVCEDAADPHSLPEDCQGQAVWVDRPSRDNAARSAYCAHGGIRYVVIPDEVLSQMPKPAPLPSTPVRKKVVATGCYDWFHSGHVRFTEEASAFGDLYVIVGHDANIRLLKGEGHPLFPEDERRYVVGSIRHVKEALISTGHGWLDADPEIRRIKPDYYVVNRDGDKGGKRDYCRRLGIAYVVLERTPAPGLPRRSSTDLRGF